MTPRKVFKLFAALMGASITLVGFAPRASACSPEPCLQAWARPADGTTVAPNLAIIEYEPGSDYTRQGHGLEEARVKTFELLTDDGEKIPVTAARASGATTAYWMKPLRALEPKRGYRIRFERPCGEGSQWIEQRFETGEVATVPDALGKAPRVTREQGQREVPTSSGSCTIEISADVAHIELDLTPEWQPILPLTHVSVRVDGEAWAELTPRDASAPITTDVVAGCEVGDSGASGFVAPGKHKVELSAQVVGQSERPETIELEVDLSCGASGGKAGSAGSEAAAMSGGGARSSASSGCSVTRARAPASAWLAAALFAALVRVRRQRRIRTGLLDPR